MNIGKLTGQRSLQASPRPLPLRPVLPVPSPSRLSIQLSAMKARVPRDKPPTPPPKRDDHPEMHLIDDEDEEDEEGVGSLEGKVMGACVKVFCTHSEPNYSLPWQRKRQFASTSSGFIIPGRLILTNAHSVEHHIQVRVKRRGDDQKFLAKVLAIGTDCDTALLTVEDPAFWEGVEPLTFGELPKLQDRVFVIGYPIGGDTISVTSGVVSRIEVTSYVHSTAELLGIQIDAAINSGNSGGPVLNEYGECVGIAFQSLAGSDAENIGYVIPAPVVEHFLADYGKHGKFTGFPELGIRWQKMESEVMREAYGMKPNQKGILIRELNPIAPSSKILKPDDILIKFDGVEVSNDGTVPFRTGERITFSYMVSQKFIEDEVDIEILRQGKLMQLRVPLGKPPRLVPPHLGGKTHPSYLIVGGLVFTPCSEPYLQSEYGADYVTEAPVKLLSKMYHGVPTMQDQQVVLLSQVLASKATSGYEDILNTQVLRFNGQEVLNLHHLAKLIRDCTEDYYRFDLEYEEVVILRRKDMEEATKEVLQGHGLQGEMSRDVEKALTKQGEKKAAAKSAAEKSGESHGKGKKEKEK